MRIEFRQARIPRDIAALVRFDKRIFPQDAFPADVWREIETWWMILNRKRIGCCAFQLHKDFQKDPRKDSNPSRRGSLVIYSTGILPEFQGYGFGRMMKAWQVSYARFRGFKRVVTNCRKSNKAIIDLNAQFGFRKIAVVPKYYDEPEEDAVVMELRLKSGPESRI